MKISGFSLARNAVKLDYPLKEALTSILPAVDELVVAVAPGDPDDDTRGLIESLDDPRIRVIDASWDDGRGAENYADLTNVALDACTGDWCLYIQADEVMHEDDLPELRRRCEELSDDDRVEGLLLDFLHFFGDFDHVQDGHGWYRREIRVVRNHVGVRSVRDAQSFRFPNERRIRVAQTNSRVFHYGWVRHPSRMEDKVWVARSHRGGQARPEGDGRAAAVFDYGPLDRLPRFRGTHPGVMADRIAAMDWADQLRMEDPPGLKRTQRHKDEKLKYRILTSIERLTGLDFNHANHGRVVRI